jgi:hypothetical protein
VGGGGVVARRGGRVCMADLVSDVKKEIVRLAHVAPEVLVLFPADLLKAAWVWYVIEGANQTDIQLAIWQAYIKK